MKFTKKQMVTTLALIAVGMVGYEVYDRYRSEYVGFINKDVVKNECMKYYMATKSLGLDGDKVMERLVEDYYSNVEKQIEYTITNPITKWQVKSSIEIAIKDICML